MLVDGYLSQFPVKSVERISVFTAAVTMGMFLPVGKSECPWCNSTQPFFGNTVERT